MKKNTIHPKDFKYMEQNPYGDAGFSQEHNRRVITEVDAWNDKMDREKDRNYKELTQERTSAVAQYLNNVSQGKGVNNIDRYFGRRHLAYLRGEQIIRQLKSNPVLVEKIKKRFEKRGKLMPL